MRSNRIASASASTGKRAAQTFTGLRHNRPCFANGLERFESIVLLPDPCHRSYSIGMMSIVDFPVPVMTNW
ncbi:MAG TPA: hypothetical protein V6C95_18225 [Coleofasciculaceae cyanobacterium]